MPAAAEHGAPTATAKPRKAAGRRKRKPITLRNIEEEEERERRAKDAGEEYISPWAPKKPSTKTKGKRKAAEASVAEGDGAVQLPTKKARQPRKGKTKNAAPANPGPQIEPERHIEPSQNAENGESEERTAQAHGAEDGESGQLSGQAQAAENDRPGENGETVQNGEPPGQVQNAENGENGVSRGGIVIPKATRRRRRQVDSQPDGVDEANAEEQQPKTTRKRKRQVVSQPDGNNEAGEAEQHPKTRRKRQRVPASQLEQPDGIDQDANNEEANGGEGSGEEANDEGGDAEQQPRQKGRPRRASTPPEAEHEIIDPGNTFMADIARRNIRVGKLSEREKKMRLVNWDEVKQRQRERQAEQQNSRAMQAEMELEMQHRENEIRERQEQVRHEIIDGEMVVVANSGQIDHDAIAEEIHEVVEEVEDDYTMSINTRSFILSNKRFPQEHMLPGQGKRWDFKSTEDFYEALRMFGTDFNMMTTLFEGVSRRSLKHKFTREERENPGLIKEILQSKDTGLKNWDDFLQASGHDNEQYDKVEQIKREMEAEAEEYRKLIEEVKAEAEEQRRQRRLAGVESDEEEGGEAESGKKKKSKKGKEKQPAFQDDEGVEILEVDENDGWGQD